jgi:hypothetical protein
LRSQHIGAAADRAGRHPGAHTALPGLLPPQLPSVGSGQPRPDRRVGQRRRVSPQV